MNDGLGKGFSDIDKRTPPATSGWFTREKRNKILEELNMDPIPPNYQHAPLGNKTVAPQGLAKIKARIDGTQLLCDAMLKIDEGDRQICLELASRLIGDTL